MQRNRVRRYTVRYGTLYGTHRHALIVLVLPHVLLALEALQVVVVVVAGGPGNGTLAAVRVGALRVRTGGRSRGTQGAAGDLRARPCCDTRS